MIQYKEGYIICSNDVKMDILDKLAKSSEFKNYTFLDLQSLKRLLTFDIKKKSLIYLFKKLNVSPYVAKEYINSLLKIHEFKDSPKSNKLYEIYTMLDNEGLIIKSPLFVNHAKNVHFTFVDYPKTKELDFVLSKIDSNNTTVILPKEKSLTKALEYHHFENIEGECAYVFSQIYKLLKSGISPKDILICNSNQDYEFIFNRYIDSYGLPISQNYGNNIIFTSECKMFLELAEQGKSFKEIVDALKNSFFDLTIVNKIINIINQYEAYDYNPNELISFFRMQFMNVSFSKAKYENEIKMITPSRLKEFKDSYVFFMNFNIEIPSVLRDEEYLTDKDKIILGLDTTKEINNLSKINLISSLELSNHLVITYSDSHSFNPEVISTLVKELNIKKISHDNEDWPFGYDKISDDLYMSLASDDLIKFNQSNKILKSNIYDDFSHGSYKNKYKQINPVIIKDIFKNGVNLSYSSMYTYLECPFKYYCKKILKIDKFENTLDARLGTFAHGILEDFELNGENFDFNQSVEFWRLEDIKKNSESQNVKDEYYFNKMANHLKVVIERIKLHKAHTSLNNVYCEKEMNVSLHDGNLKFEGFIDKVWYSDDLSYVAIIDYKTGKDIASLSNLNHGENLQLPVYIYLLRNSEMFKSSKVVGVYLQKINIIIPEKGNKTDIEQINSNINIEGYSDYSYINMIDDTYGDYLKKFKLKKDGTPNADSLLLDQTDVDKLYKIVEDKIEETYQNILAGNFNIQEKYIGSKNVSCEYCDFRDVCFKTYKDRIYLNIEPFKVKDGESNEDE